MSRTQVFSAALVVVLLSGSAWGADVTRFVVTGDSRGGDNGVNSTILNELVTAIIAEDADLVVFSGDLTNDGTQAQLEYWVQLFMDPLELAGIEVYPCRGNHDGIITAWNTVFSGERAFPANGPEGKINLTYSVATDNALFLVLDDIVINQAWIDQQLEGKTQPHLFVTNHYPAFQVAHADCLALMPEERDTFWDSIGGAGGRTYFTGHDHFYDHARVLDSNSHSIEHYVVGTAGAPLYDWGGTYADARVQPVFHSKTYGYLLVEIEGTEVRLTFKERVAPDVYQATSDVYIYGTPFTGDLPVAGVAGLFIAVSLVLFALFFLGRRLMGTEVA